MCSGVSLLSVHLGHLESCGHHLLVRVQNKWKSPRGRVRVRGEEGGEEEGGEKKRGRED